MEKGYTVNIVQLNSFFSSTNSIYTITIGVSMPNGTNKLAVASGKDIPETISECIKKITGIKLIIQYYSSTTLATTVKVKFNKRTFQQTEFDADYIVAIANALFDILSRLPRK